LGLGGRHEFLLACFVGAGPYGKARGNGCTSPGKLITTIG
jgi:hypothetical protein